MISQSITNGEPQLEEQNGSDFIADDPKTTMASQAGMPVPGVAKAFLPVIFLSDKGLKALRDRHDQGNSKTAIGRVFYNPNQISVRHLVLWSGRPYRVLLICDQA